MGVLTGPEIPRGDLDSSINTESASSIIATFNAFCILGVLIERRLSLKKSKQNSLLFP